MKTFLSGNCMSGPKGFNMIYKGVEYRHRKAHLSREYLDRTSRISLEKSQRLVNFKKLSHVGGTEWDTEVINQYLSTEINADHLDGDRYTDLRPECYNHHTCLSSWESRDQCRSNVTAGNIRQILILSNLTAHDTLSYLGSIYGPITSAKYSKTQSIRTWMLFLLIKYTKIFTTWKKTTPMYMWRWKAEMGSHDNDACNCVHHCLGGTW